MWRSISVISVPFNRRIYIPNPIDDNLNVRFNLHQAAGAGKGTAGRTFISGKHVHAAAVIDCLGIRFIPGTGIQAGNTGHYAVGDLGNRPLPRLPILFKGRVKRCGAYTTSFWDSPRMQAFHPGPGWLSVPMRVIRPSVTCTFNRQRPPQSNEQVVVIIFSLLLPTMRVLSLINSKKSNLLILTC